MRAYDIAALNISGTDAAIFTAKTRNLDASEVIESCPYNIPRNDSDGTLAKCDMDYDRVFNGLQPACVKVIIFSPFLFYFAPG
jgi:Fe-S-cluster-containing dehydrogenase component